MMWSLEVDPGVIPKNGWVFCSLIVEFWRGTKKGVGLLLAICGALTWYQKRVGLLLANLWSSGVVPKKWWAFCSLFVELWRGTKKGVGLLLAICGALA